MLDIRTFDAAQGGNVLYKAFAHPLIAERLASLAERLTAAGPLALYDPEGVADALWALNPGMPAPSECYVHDVEQVGLRRVGVPTRPLVDVARSAAATLLIAGFDTARIEARIAPLLPAGLGVVSLDAARLPSAMLTNPRRTLDRLKLRDQLRLLPRCRRAVDAVGDGELLGQPWRSGDAALAAPL